MFKRGNKCPHCGVKYSEEFILRSEKRKSEALKAAYKRAVEYGEPWGRPKTYDRNLIKQLREKGMSIRKIANDIGCSSATVFSILKELK